jgi:alkyl sulfatase BDS1-like metallo-beta-lactamase superfamily hydrolase
VPSHLKPASQAEQGREIAALAGGVEPILKRALEKLVAGDLTLAAHLIDWAAAAAPDDKAVHRARDRIYAACAETSLSLMSRGIFSAASAESALKARVTPADGKD